MRKILIALLAFASLSCGGDSTGPAATVTGAWEGVLTGATARADLTQSGDDVSGDISVYAGGSVLTFQINGIFANPGISLNVTSAGYEPMIFTGELSEDRERIVGVMNGSGYVDERLTLTRSN